MDTPIAVVPAPMMIFEMFQLNAHATQYRFKIERNNPEYARKLAANAQLRDVLRQALLRNYYADVEKRTTTGASSLATASSQCVVMPN